MIAYSKSDNTDPVWRAIVSQVARLEGLPRFPFGTEAKRELCLALLSADTLDQAIFIIDRVLESDTTEICPGPPTIRRMINAEQDRGKSTADEIRQNWERRDFGFRCPACQDFGIAESTRPVDLRSVASYCSCERGAARRNANHDEYPPDRINSARRLLLSRKVSVK